MNFLGLIPARFGSTRFEGKPLKDIWGKPMIQHVYEKASQALNCVYVATDDERIKKAVENFGGKVVMTSANHDNGTSRCSEAWDIIKSLETTDFDVAVNIQGDEPLLNPDSVEQIKACFNNSDAEFATLIIPVTKPEDILDGTEVFVTFNTLMNALYFSRTVIPVLRNYPKKEWFNHHQFYKHLGMYAYTYDALKKFTSMKPSSLEMAEMLEQNRWIENGMDLRVGVTPHEATSVDTLDDLKKVRSLMAKKQ